MGQLEQNPPCILSKKVPKVPSCQSGSTHYQKMGIVVVFVLFFEWVDPSRRRSEYTRETHQKTIAENGFDGTPLTHSEKVGFGSRFTHVDEVGRSLLDYCWTIAVPLLDETPQIYMRIPLTFAGRKEDHCWTKEVVPTHNSKVGRISGCVKKLCIHQTSRLGLTTPYR